MRLEPRQTTSFTIMDAPGLDPITVVLQDIGPGIGQVIVTCYGLAWTAFWGAMGERTIRQFLCCVEADYIATRMWIPHERRVKHRYAYLVRIIHAVKEALVASSELES